MDGNQFETFLRDLTTASSRRGAVVGLLGGTFGLLRLTESQARHKKKHKKKKGGGSPPDSPPASAPPPPPFTCPGGQKVCGTTCIPAAECCEDCGGLLNCCNGACVNLAADGANCGACGHTCATNLCVNNGACECQGSDANCPGTCFCAATLQGGTVCVSEVGQSICTTDVDCFLGQTCLANNRCSVACLV